MGDSVQESQSTGNVDVPSAQLAPILRSILQHNNLITEQNQTILQLLNYHVESLPPKSGPDAASSAQTSRRLSSQQTAAEHHDTRRKSPNLPPSENDDQTFTGDRPFQSMWTDVLAQHSSQVPAFVKAYHQWKRPSTVRSALLGRNSWCSKEYYLAYPRLFDFLAVDEPMKKCHAQVVIRDFYGKGAAPRFSAYNEIRSRQLLTDPTSKGSARGRGSVCVSRRDDPLRAAQLWKSLEGCACSSERKETAAAPSDGDVVCMRTININDVSPRVLKCLLASTPPADLDRLAAFMQRHLAASNWGTVLPSRHGDKMSSFSMEYHFSFYFVTANRLSPSGLKPDVRGLRRSARFGAHPLSQPTKFIHEESLSFLLVGHFKDVSTCIQMAESYFKHDPYDPDNGEACSSPIFSVIQQDATPAALLLAWMASALHHVSGRWRWAIDSVQAEIQLSRQTVFMDDRNDLMTDDPNFSLSKTYFWALQAYRLFEDTITDTVSAWRSFKEESLPRLRDERMPTAAWFAAVQGIDKEIVSLDSNIEKIRRRVAEITELRRALDSASVIFDSRTSVRQADTVRLLTVVTSICLPVILVASIFGMQFIGTATGYIIAFGVTMAAVIVTSIFVIFNVANGLGLWNKATSKFTGRLRSSMQRHHRKVWHGRAVALKEYQTASRVSSERKGKPTTAWFYFLYVVEYLCVNLPVRELAAASAFFRGNSYNLDDRERDGRGHSSIKKQRGASAMEARLKHAQIKYEERQREKRRDEVGVVPVAMEEFPRSVPSASKSALRGFRNVIRAFLIPFWIVIVLIEFSLLVCWFALAGTLRKPPPQRWKTPHRTARQRAVDAMGLSSISRSEDEIEHLRKPPEGDYSPPASNPPKSSPKQQQATKHASSGTAEQPLKSHPVPKVQGRFSFEGESTAPSSRNTVDEIEALSRTGTPQPSNARAGGPGRPSDIRVGSPNRPGDMRAGSPKTSNFEVRTASPSRPNFDGRAGSPNRPTLDPRAGSPNMQNLDPRAGSPSMQSFETRVGGPDRSNDPRARGPNRPADIRVGSPNRPDDGRLRSPNGPGFVRPMGSPTSPSASRFAPNTYRPLGADDPRRRPPMRPPPAPPGRLPPSPPRPQVPYTPSSPTATSDHTSRPGTAQTQATDGFGPLPEIFTRSEPLRRLSADSITQLYASSGRNSASSGELAPGETRDRPTSLTLPGSGEQASSPAKGRNTIRKSEYVDILNLGRAPRPPPKDGGSGTGASA